jgi:hypothetical protein
MGAGEIEREGGAERGMKHRGVQWGRSKEAKNSEGSGKRRCFVPTLQQIRRPGFFAWFADKQGVNEILIC